MSKQGEALDRASRLESSTHDWFWSIRLTVFFESGEESFVSDLEPRVPLDEHVRSVLRSARLRTSNAPLVSSVLNAVLRLSREAPSTPSMNLPEDLVAELAGLRATIDVDSYLVDPSRVIPPGLRP
jgi:hypothetical protein